MTAQSEKINVVIFCDESITKGAYFSNFYGAALVTESDLPAVNRILEQRKSDLSLGQEVKFTKITELYAEKYITLLKTFFELIKDGRIKVRIMFTQNNITPILTAAQRKNSYFLLYYQFVKHGFGLQHIEGDAPVAVKMRFDLIPGKGGQVANFKDYICRLQNTPELSARNVTFAPSDIGEIDSKKYAILQCLDVVLGAMQFRLNEKHKEIPAGKKRRAKRTVAKEKVYKAIRQEILDLYPGYSFNAGVTTAVDPSVEFRWTAPYRHWLFKPALGELNLKYVPKKK